MKQYLDFASNIYIYNFYFIYYFLNYFVQNLGIFFRFVAWLKIQV